MELIQLTPTAYQLRGGTNVGLVTHGNAAVVVDAGLDRDAAKKILRHVESLDITLAAVVITHAHADHFGGAALIRERLRVPVYAPPLEAAIIANPLLEPLYLCSGAMLIAELRHKFTLAEACPVDGELASGEQTFAGVPLEIIPTPGHAPGQVAVAGGGACFVADAVFAPMILAKHGIPFYVNVDQALATLDSLRSLADRYAVFVPGHGPAVEQITPWVEQNAGRLTAIRATVQRVLAEADDIGCIVQRTCACLGVTVPNPVIYLLIQTTVLACLASLQQARLADVAVVENRLAWRARAVPRQV